MTIRFALLSLALLLSVYSALSAESASAPQARLNDQRRGEAPVSLTSSDGTGLRLARFEAQAVISGPLAFTELHLHFDNPESRVLEGRFQITLPPGAAISRFAMRMGDSWQEAEVVELQAAREAYEDALHRRTDPALLEKQAGNQFQARIFPIPAGGRKELILSYSQELTRTQPYVLPLGGLPKVEKLRATALVGQPATTLQLALDNEAPSGDWEVTGGAPVQALIYENLALFEVSPPLSERAEPVDSLLVLFDTSASRTAGFPEQRRLLAELLQAFPRARHEVACFDQEVSGDDFRQRPPLGATDLGGALAWAAGRRGFTRLLLITDGVVTAGNSDFGKHAAALKNAGFERCDAVLVGGIRDPQALGKLCFPSSGTVLDGALGPREIARRLQLAVAAPFVPEVGGARWVWPPLLEGLQPGDTRLVFAELKQPAEQVQLGGAPMELAPANGPLLKRAAAQAQIARLEASLADAEPEQQVALRAEILKLSKSNRVVSSLTSLLVLETDADYKRFGLDRTALADILVVGGEGLETRQGRQLVAAPPPGPDGFGDDEGGAPRPGFPRWGQPNSPGALNTTFTESASASGSRRPEGSATRLDPLATIGGSIPARPAETAQMGEAGGATRLDPFTAATGRTATEAPQSFSPPGYNQWGNSSKPPAVTGQLAEVQKLVRARQTETALEQARSWHDAAPGDVLALIALGEALEAHGNRREAARAYGSLIDLFPGRADLLRYAGCRLECLGDEGSEAALDAFRRAAEQRPDHPSSHRMLAFALLRSGDYEGACDSLERGLRYPYPVGRFASYKGILQEDLGLVAAAWCAQEPGLRTALQTRLGALGTVVADKPSTRFILTWETDANDVDFHIEDGRGGHAYYSIMTLPSGGRLYGDVVTGYGPECFAIPGKAAAYPYRLSAHYYRRGPMGYGMGKVEVIQHDGRGHLLFEQHPFVVMNDHAFVDLGLLKGPLTAAPSSGSRPRGRSDGSRAASRP